MQTNTIYKLIKSACLIYFFLFSLQVFAQKNKNTMITKPEPVTYTRKEYAQIIDSLYNVILEYRAGWQKAQGIIHSRDSSISEMRQKMEQMQAKIGVLETKNSDFKGRNLKLDQSNRILIIFNSVVGLLLLITLVWFLRNIGKKKSADKHKAISPFESTSTTEISSVTPAQTNHRYFENKLEQLERLGKLKEKGILNEEEFNNQKQQILSGGQ